MSVTQETTIRVPVTLRDKIRLGAAERSIRQADFIDLALRELEQAEFLRAVSEVAWDEEPAAEARQWDETDLSAELDPWDPRP